MNLTRRNLLTTALASGAFLSLRGAMPRRAFAAPDDKQLMLVCYMSGGWDQLLALDPRDNTVFTGSKIASSGIQPAYETITDTFVTDVMSATGGKGIQKKSGSPLSFGPAVPADFITKHSGDVSIVRGINMGTLTHEVGRRYFTTGQFPRGLSPVGSSLTSITANAQGSANTIPNLSVLTESYNVGLAPYASPIQVTDGGDVAAMLDSLGTPLAVGQEAIDAYDVLDENCRQTELDANSIVSGYRASREKAKSMVHSGKASLFNFAVGDPIPEALGVTKLSELNSEKGFAAVAAQALMSGVSQAVSVRIQSNLDDHDAWATDHPQKIFDGFTLLGKMIDLLKGAPSPFGDSGSTWDHTTLVLFSEFSRTPLLNVRDGRDHHLAGSCMVAGPGLNANKVIGATSDVAMAVEPIDLDTGDVDAGGTVITAADVIKTVLTSVGLADVSLGNQPKNLIKALLKG